MPTNISRHPLVKHKLSLLRDKHTPHHAFRQLMLDITTLLIYEATIQAPTDRFTIDTPIASADCEHLIDFDPIIVPILRAGLGMLDPFLQCFPNASVAHLGLKRDEQTHNAHLYYANPPKQTRSRTVYICDPMLATGGTAKQVCDIIKAWDVKEIHYLCIIASPEGLNAFKTAHPDLHITCAHLDSHLNDQAYIVPGLGDAGDRLYGTE